MDLTVLSNIWNAIVESNTFNFIIFISLIALIFKKINVRGIIDAIHAKILKVIEEVNQEKEEALLKLSNAEKSVENLAQELDTIVNDAQKSAEVIGNKILEEAKKQVENIESNALKVIDAEEKILISELTKSTSAASVMLAKQNIQKTLNEAPNLHEKYINESIDELDKLTF